MGNYDMASGLATLGVLGLLIGLFFSLLGIVVFVLWILVPFAVFSIRRRMEDQQVVLLRIERRLAQIADQGPPPERPAAPPLAPL